MIDDDGDDDDGPPDFRGGDESDLKSLLPKTLHKALVTGVSAVLMTEEGIRNALSDMRLPKEAIAYVVQHTERSRKEVFSALSHEIKRYLSGIDLAGALRKALTGLKVEVRADIHFRDDAVVKDVATQVTTAQPDAEPRAKKRRAPKRKPRPKPEPSGGDPGEPSAA